MTVDTAGEVMFLTAVKPVIDPDPLAARPMAVLLLVQVNVVPAIDPVKVNGPVCEPEQNV